MAPKGKSTAATMAMRQQQQQQQLQQQQQMALLHSPLNMASDGAASEAASSAAIGKLSPLGFGKARDAKSLQEAEREARKKAAAEEKARREAEAAEAERIAAEEAAAAERAAEEERIRRLPPPRPVTPPFQQLELPALTFMWLRDRVPSVSGNVQPSSDKKHVLIPAAMTEQLFYGRLVLAAIHGYLPRSDEVRSSQRAINHAAGVSVPPTSVTPPLTQSSSHPLALPASMVTPKKGGGGSSSLSSSANSAIAAIDPNWTAPERLAQRLEAWGLVRGHCKTLGLEMSDALVTEIADHCDHDSLMSFVEGLHQCLKRYDIARREYSKALVAEARAGNRTRAEELHREPPPPHVTLIAKKQVPHVVLDGVKGGRRDTSPTTSASASVAPPVPDVDSPPPVPEGTAPGALRSDRTPTMPSSRAAEAAGGDAASASPRRSSGVDASCQTEGRCIIIMPGDYRDAYVQSVPDVMPADPPAFALGCVKREDSAASSATALVGAFVTSGVTELVHSEPASPVTTAPGESEKTTAEAVVANDSETPEPTAAEVPPPATEAAPGSSAAVVVAEEAPTVSEVSSDEAKAVEAVSPAPTPTTAAAPADADAPADDVSPAAPSPDAVDEHAVTATTTSETPGSNDAALTSAPEAAPPTTGEEGPSPS